MIGSFLSAVREAQALKQQRHIEQQLKEIRVAAARLQYFRSLPRVPGPPQRSFIPKVPMKKENNT